MATLQVSRGSSDTGGDVLDASGITAAAVCGDGVVNGIGEAFDDGHALHTDACPDTCVGARWGDGFVQAAMESCDDVNTFNRDACPNTCQVARGRSFGRCRPRHVDLRARPRCDPPGSSPSPVQVQA